MRAMFDLNVFVDIAEAREGFYEKSREAACASEVEDFEDAVVDETAFSVGCDVIVTRNKKHFISSKVKAVSPEEFIGMTLPLQHGE